MTAVEARSISECPKDKMPVILLEGGQTVYFRKRRQSMPAKAKYWTYEGNDVWYLLPKEERNGQEGKRKTPQANAGEDEPAGSRLFGPPEKDSIRDLARLRVDPAEAG